MGMGFPRPRRCVFWNGGPAAKGEYPNLARGSLKWHLCPLLLRVATPPGGLARELGFSVKPHRMWANHHTVRHSD